MRVESTRPDERVARLCADLESRSGLRFPRVEIHARLGRRSSSALADTGRTSIRISQTAARDLSDDGLAWLLAHELAHTKPTCRLRRLEITVRTVGVIAAITAIASLATMALANQTVLLIAAASTITS